MRSGVLSVFAFCLAVQKEKLMSLHAINIFVESRALKIFPIIILNISMQSCIH